MILSFYSNFLAAILKIANMTVIVLYFSLETEIFAFYGEFPIRMRMSPYSTNDVRMAFFLGFVSEMESPLKMYIYGSGSTSVHLHSEPGSTQKQVMLSVGFY